MYTTFDVIVAGKLIYSTGSTLGGTEEEAHQRALEVAIHLAKHDHTRTPVVKRVEHDSIISKLNLNQKGE